MKKKLISSISALLLCCSSLFGVASCGGTGGGGESEAPKGMITATPLSVAELGEGFNEKYLPDTSSIRALTGKVDVCLDFEGTQAGWQALAAEYERLQGGGVQVNVNTTYAGSTYADKLNAELTATSTDWDIVEGNLGYGNTNVKCVDMFPSVAAINPYCGKDVKWNSVLKPEAYKTKEADNSGISKIMNTEIMQTCWFINDVAFQAAVDEGYTNADGFAEYPITWNDLINLCSKMEEAGYTNPLGITLCNASIESLQFTWLLRVYGDYYYRQFYEYIMGGEAGTIWENYDPTATVPENLAGYGNQYAKILSILFDKDCDWGPGYVGFESPLYRDFVGNLAKMKGHLIKDVDKIEFGDLRDKFETQSGGKGAPQILLDYQGFGINYEKAEKAGFELGYFDYPVMESDYVPAETITRDIGGNGGFLSVVNHLGDNAQNELNKDFVKFVLSPYGQTVYYKGLAKANKVPKGLSTVKNELVVIPTEWVDFFNRSNQVISFNGDVDANNFLSWGVRYTCGYPKGQAIICDNWRGLLMTGLAEGQTLTVAAFCSYWAAAAEDDAHEMTADYGWPSDVWTNPSYALG
ncbi:MAG: hypothetical protein IKA61_01165 [Clostridia bacterium]|nr:hypothetical protein [Clostridia bacterium]